MSNEGLEWLDGNGRWESRFGPRELSFTISRPCAVRVWVENGHPKAEVRLLGIPELSRDWTDR